MTGDTIMHLDLKAEGDEGLLVPFGKATNKTPQTDDHNPLFAPPPPAYKHVRRSFFRRRERKSPEEPKSEEPEPKNVKKQATTFKFPSAPQAFADEEEIDDPYSDNPAIHAKSLQKQDKEPQKEQESSGEDSSTSEEKGEGAKNHDRENQAPPTTRRQTQDKLNAAPTNSFRKQTHPRLSDSRAEASQMMKKYTSKRLEGHGNSQPEPDTPLSGFSRMLKRLRGPEMKSMKIATEDTKDERTLGETVTHVMQVALVPEVYAEDMEGEGNLGFYRPIRSTPQRRSGPPPSQQRVMDSVKVEKENVLLKKNVAALRGHVGKLEETIKTKDLEAAVWKLRAQELEEELKKYKVQNDDNSTIEPHEVDPDHDCDSGIDHEWDATKEKMTEVQEEVLVDTTFVPKKITFDPLQESDGDEPKEAPGSKREDETMNSSEKGDGTHSKDRIPLIAPPQVVAANKKKEEEEEEDDDDDSGDETDEDGEEEESTNEVKEEVLVDTNITPEPVVFDPMKASTEDDDAKEDNKLFDLIASFSEDAPAESTKQKAEDS